MKKIGHQQEIVSTTILYSLLSDLMGIEGLKPKENNKDILVQTEFYEATKYEDMDEGK